MISIIVPIYNIKEYLPRCLDSICMQTYQKLEIILVDDGSTDGCYEICEKYREKDSRIIVIHKENGGLVSARKAGIKAASGEYIAYVDGDDWIEPNMYERMHQVITEQNVDVIMCGRYENTGESSKQVFHGIAEGRYGKQELVDRIYPKMIVNEAFFEWGIFPSVWDKLFRRGCVERFQMAVDDEVVMGEDAACTYPCLLNVDSIYILHECLYHYRQTTSSMVKQIQDYSKERKQFRILYNSVNNCFERDKEIFDLRDQWLKYVLFLMIPRADSLYGDFDKLQYLFPFSSISKGSNIVLYGAGTYGQRLYRYLEQTGFCKVVLWVDRNFVELQKMGLDVKSPKDLNNLECNTIVIANTYARSRKSLCEELTKKFSKKTIHMIDEELILSKETVRGFGLSDMLHFDDPERKVHIHE